MFVEPKLKEAVCFVAAKEYLRLIIQEFNMDKDPKTENKNPSTGATIGSDTISNSKSKHDLKINGIVCKDTTYYLLWILEETLVNNQGYESDNEILSGKNLY